MSNGWLTPETASEICSVTGDPHLFKRISDGWICDYCGVPSNDYEQQPLDCFSEMLDISLPTHTYLMLTFMLALPLAPLQLTWWTITSTIRVLRL